MTEFAGKRPVSEQQNSGVESTVTPDEIARVTSLISEALGQASRSSERLTELQSEAQTMTERGIDSFSGAISETKIQNPENVEAAIKIGEVLLDLSMQQRRLRKALGDDEVILDPRLIELLRQSEERKSLLRKKISKDPVADREIEPAGDSLSSDERLTFTNNSSYRSFTPNIQRLLLSYLVPVQGQDVSSDKCNYLVSAICESRKGAADSFITNLDADPEVARQYLGVLRESIGAQHKVQAARWRTLEADGSMGMKKLNTYEFDEGKEFDENFMKQFFRKFDTFNIDLND